MSVISDKYKCIFIRIPKAASTSIENIFRVVDPDSIYSSNQQPYGHHSWKAIREEAGEERWNSYYKFCVVRDPEEWVMSNMRHMATQWWENEMIDGSLLKELDVILEDNIYTSECGHYTSVGWRSRKFNTYYARDVDGFMAMHMDWWKPYNHWQQNHWIPDDIDCILKYSDINNQWKELCDRLNIPIDILPHYNVTEGEKCKFSVPAKVRIKELWKEDMTIYEGL